MCTAITYQTKDFYFGRTLDLDESYAEEVTITPRAFPLGFRDWGRLDRHHAIIGFNQEFHLFRVILVVAQREARTLQNRRHKILVHAPFDVSGE